MKPEKAFKVFISYSWSNPEHEQRVITLAEHLMADGVEVVIDKWDLKEGQDSLHFMEGMVKSKEVDKVLIVLDKGYTEKANDRKGGVGTETQIISPEIYSNVLQEKFIPIIAERDESGNPYIPAFLKSRIYIDLSQREHYDKNYERLLRNIYKRPAHVKPKRGKPPSYLFEDSPVSSKTSILIRRFDAQVERNPSRINTLCRDFFDALYEGLKAFELEISSQNEIEIGKIIVDSLNQYKPLRDDYIELLHKIAKGDNSLDFDIITRFFEHLPKLLYPSKRTSWSDYEYDNFKFIIAELFLYLITVPLKYENYKLLEEVLHAAYLIKDGKNNNKDLKNFGSFNLRIDSIDQYYREAFSGSYINPMAEFLISRIPQGLEEKHIVEADLLCFYIGALNNICWFPTTYIYQDRELPFDFFVRLASLKHFNKVKDVLGFDNLDELKERIVNLKEHDASDLLLEYFHHGVFISPIWLLIDPDQIGTRR